MRRTKAEQIIDIRKALKKNPGTTLTGIAGIARMGIPQTREVLSAMQEEGIILYNGNSIYLKKTTPEATQ